MERLPLHTTSITQPTLLTTPPTPTPDRLYQPSTGYPNKRANTNHQHHMHLHQFQCPPTPCDHAARKRREEDLPAHRGVQSGYMDTYMPRIGPSPKILAEFFFFKQLFIETKLINLRFSELLEKCYQLIHVKPNLT